MSEMTFIINCNTTDIHWDFSRFHGLEWNFLPTTRVVHSQRHLKQSAVSAITLEGYRYDWSRGDWCCSAKCLRRVHYRRQINPWPTDYPDQLVTANHSCANFDDNPCFGRQCTWFPFLYLWSRLSRTRTTDFHYWLGYIRTRSNAVRLSDVVWIS